MSFADWKVWHFETNVVFGDDDDYGEAVWDAAVAAERERCAKESESRILVYVTEEGEAGYRQACIDIAAAIRSGVNP